MNSNFKKIDFEAYKKFLGLKKTIEGDWMEQDNGVLVKPFISEEESERHNLTYIGLSFSKPTDGHFYKTQLDTIYFKTDGKIEFYHEYEINRKISDGEATGKEKTKVPFSAGDAIEITPPVVRKLIPKKRLEIELIVQPRFNPEDEVHVYD